jgi:hypothetical protein
MLSEVQIAKGKHFSEPKVTKFLHRKSETITVDTGVQPSAPG